MSSSTTVKRAWHASIPSDLGGISLLDELVLTGTRSLGDNAYPARLSRLLERSTGRKWDYSQTLNILNRMERYGYVISSTKRQKLGNKNIHTRCFSLTPEGEELCGMLEDMRWQIQMLGEQDEEVYRGDDFSS